MSHASAKEVRILLVDDHPFLREGLISTLSSYEDLLVCGEAASTQEALKAVQKLKPDVVVTDITLEGRSGLELIRDLQVLHPKLPVVVLSMHDEKIYGKRAIQAGAKAYVMKREKVDKLLRAIRKVLAGGLHVSEELSDFLLSGLSTSKTPKTLPSPISQLTAREFEVFRLIGQGKKPSEIATNLSISIKTVNSHRSNIREKLGSESFSELLVFAIRWFDSDVEEI